jgi:signal transduction histidine kinase
VETQVWDTGCGLGPEIIGRIFDPFFTTRRKGTGLGLTIVHNVVSAHQGSIEADNRPEGGAVFTIVLPKRGGPDSDEATAHGAPRNAEETELCQRES